jgi:hypothetical protein
MRRGWAIVAAILGVLLVVGIAVGAYHAGVNTGVRDAAGPGHPIEVVGGPYGWHGGFGFFPFGFLFFPLFVIGIVLLIGFAFGGPRRWGHHGGWGPGGYGPWSDEARNRFEERAGEWHRRQHEQTSTTTDPGGGPPPA